MQTTPLLTCALLAFATACTPVETQEESMDILNGLAEDYVRLALVIGQYDDAFVDAYFGPDSLRPQGTPAVQFPKDSLLYAVTSLSGRIAKVATTAHDRQVAYRALWMLDQLVAFSRRINVFAGTYGTFDEESIDLFGAAAPVYDEAHFTALLKSLDALLPGEGNVQSRFQTLANRFIIPKEKLDTVFKAAIDECRARTLKYYQLPEGENFELEFVNNKPWSGYNWYKGNYRSLIQINTDLNIFIDRAIDVGSHESYPGHHVYNMLLEQKLFGEKGFVEVSMYPLFSPQSLIAEGTANYGIDVAFPGDEKTVFAREVLLPLAGLDTSGIDLYFKALAIKGQLNYVRNEVGRGLLNSTMTEEEAQRWLQDYGLYNGETAAKSISFIKAYRSYVINYNYGLDLVRTYIESRGGTADNPEKRWQLFGELLSHQIRISDLMN